MTFLQTVFEYIRGHIRTYVQGVHAQDANNEGGNEPIQVNNNNIIEGDVPDPQTQNLIQALYEQDLEDLGNAPQFGNTLQFSNEEQFDDFNEEELLHLFGLDEEEVHNLVLDDEGAMRALNTRERTFFNQLKDEPYKALFEAVGVESAIDGLREYLKARFEISQDADLNTGRQQERLPFDVSENIFLLLTQNQKQFYYQNVFHSAARYISKESTPFLNRNASYLNPESKHYDIRESDFETIAYLWIALQDPQLRNAHEWQDMFASTLALMARAHNCDFGNDDLKPDNPICNPGVTRPLYLFWVSLRRNMQIRNQADDVQALVKIADSIDSVINAFKDRFIYKELVNKIKSNSDKAQLSEIKNIMDKQTIDRDRLTLDEQTLLNQFYKIDEVALNAFYEELENDEDNKDKDFNGPVKAYAETFESYKAMCVYLSKMPFEMFYDIIVPELDASIKQPSQKLQEAKKSAQILVPIAEEKIEKKEKKTKKEKKRKKKNASEVFKAKIQVGSSKITIKQTSTEGENKKNQLRDLEQMLLSLSVFLNNPAGHTGAEDKRKEKEKENDNDVEMMELCDNFKVLNIKREPFTLTGEKRSKESRVHDLDLLGNDQINIYVPPGGKKKKLYRMDLGERFL